MFVAHVSLEGGGLVSASFDCFSLFLLYVYRSYSSF